MPLIMHAVSFLSMITVALCLNNKLIVYSMFLLFESTVGVFYPCYGKIKAEKIPEEIRSAVMNIFRILLNAFVVLSPLKINHSLYLVFAVVLMRLHFYVITIFTVLSLLSKV